MSDDGYITPEVAKRLGYSKREDGGYQRLSLIERYFQKGWLEFGDKRLTGDIRLDSATRLASDFYYSRFPQAGATDYTKDRVDGGQNKTEPESVLIARDRFFKAMKSIPQEFRKLIRDIVLFEKRPLIAGMTKRQYDYNLHLMKVDLCRGLDRLACHYGARPTNCKIKAMRIDEQTAPAETPRRYTIEVK